jgi:hypothetical protein
VLALRFLGSLPMRRRSPRWHVLAFVITSFFLWRGAHTACKRAWVGAGGHNWTLQTTQLAQGPGRTAPWTHGLRLPRDRAQTQSGTGGYRR